MPRFDFKNMTIESAEEECFRVYGTQFGHNMIGLIISEVEKKFGKDEAGKLFEKYQG